MSGSHRVRVSPPGLPHHAATTTLAVLTLGVGLLVSWTVGSPPVSAPAAAVVMIAAHDAATITVLGPPRDRSCRELASRLLAAGWPVATPAPQQLAAPANWAAAPAATVFYAPNQRRSALAVVAADLGVRQALPWAADTSSARGLLVTCPGPVANG